MQSKNKQQLLQELKAQQERKLKLLQIKEQAKDKWNDKLQDELDTTVEEIVDLKEAIENAKDAYEVPKGTEKHIHLMIIRGRRFNPSTGVEESEPYKQIFSRSEWELFKKNAALLGYTIIEVLHDPYNEAVNYIKK